ncbi:hypothetical protein EIN_251140 [Entamoeba invadens IP1]|uniref:UBX domain-containing protein n=1 Tax=Entamoeba invadens IP1 TaxID=370355 RepID=A0A0A1UEG3_ENTIV|nr:hypothetical protein EIN_251140 [Entamoeba invadens IP1]ELP94970.1 hypothetical protein EIN_251140 [Entamoeba invadens IP1]|eukprot:XP_004261741.1 hypothetical protein EIN_251140 [Entamoeba invadens IP1]
MSKQNDYEQIDNVEEEEMLTQIDPNDKRKMVNVAFRMPTGGTTKSRFEVTCTVKDLFVFLEENHLKRKDVEILHPLKRVPLKDERVKLEEFYPSILFHVVMKKKLGEVKEAKPHQSQQQPPARYLSGERYVDPTQTIQAPVQIQQEQMYQQQPQQRQQHVQPEPPPKNKFLRFMKGFFTGK